MIHGRETTQIRISTNVKTGNYDLTGSFCAVTFSWPGELASWISHNTHTIRCFYISVCARIKQNIHVHYGC